MLVECAHQHLHTAHSSVCICIKQHANAAGDSSYTTGLAVALGVAIALMQHVLRSVTYHLMELCPSFAGIVLANIGGMHLDHH